MMPEYLLIAEILYALDTKKVFLVLFGDFLVFWLIIHGFFHSLFVVFEINFFYWKPQIRGKQETQFKNLKKAIKRVPKNPAFTKRVQTFSYYLLLSKAVEAATYI